MPKSEQNPAKARILSHVAEGELDEALRLVEESSSLGHQLGVSVLIPLARALLSNGRDVDALAILERASHASTFGGDLGAIATQVGMQDSRLREAVEQRRVESEATKLSNLPEAEMLETTIDGRDAKLVDGLIDTNEDRISETERVLLPESSTTSPAVSTDTTPEARDFIEAPTTEEGKLSQDEMTATIDEDRAALEELTDEEALKTEKKSARCTPSEDLTRPLNLGEVEARQRPKSSPTDGADLLLAEDSGETQKIDISDTLDDSRETWTKPIDLGKLQLPRSPDPTPVDPIETEATRRIESPESLLKREASRELKAVAVEAQALRASSFDATNKLQMPDIEVVGFFSAGVGTSRAMDNDQQQLTPKQEQVDSPKPEVSVTDTLEAERALHYHKTYETTEKVVAPEARQTEEAPKSLAKKRLFWIALALAGFLGLAVTIGIIRHHRLESTELERVRTLRTDDTFSSHQQALTLLSRLAKRYPDGAPCAEFAIENVQMWGRFGLGREHLNASKAALERCNDDSEPALTARALLSYYGSDIGTTLHVAKQGVARFPQSPRLRTILGLAFEARDMPAEAAEEYTAARSIDPSYLPAALYLARFHRRSGRRGEARVVLDRLRRRSPSHVEAQVEELLLALDRASKSPRPEALRALEERASELEALAQSQPPAIAGRVALARGRLALARGQVDRAGILFSKARRLGRLDSESAYHISHGLLLAGDLETAAEVAQQYETDSLQKALRRALLYVSLGRPVQARRLLSQPLLRDGQADTSPEAQRQAQSLRIRLEAECAVMNGEPLTGLRLLDGLADLESDDAVRYTRARLLELTGQYQQAELLLEEIATPPWATCSRARHFLLNGDPDRALEELNAPAAPTAPCTIRLRIEIARELGDQISVISSLRSLLRLDPRPGTRIELARSVWRERGAQAGLSELAPLLSAPPTGLDPLLAAAELLAEMRADRSMGELLQRARRAEATENVLSTVNARYERRCQRPQAAYRAFGQAISAEGSTIPQLEKAAVLIDVERVNDANRILGDVSAPPCSTSWSELVTLRARVISIREGMAGADLFISRSLRECPSRIASTVTQQLNLERVQLALDARALNEARALLRNVPQRPRTPRIAYLSGRIAESEGDRGRAVTAYERALEIDESYIRALERLIILTDNHRYRRRLDDLRVRGATEPLHRGRLESPLMRRLLPDDLGPARNPSQRERLTSMRTKARIRVARAHIE